MNYLRSVGISILVIYLYVGVIRTCNLPAINQCIVLLNSSTTTDVLNDGLSAIPPTEVLNQLCKAREGYKACYDPLSKECKSNVIFSMMFGIIDKTLTYLCIDGYNEILQHESCWNQTGVRDGTIACHKHQNTMITFLKQRATVLDVGDLRNNWCSILENTSDCMTDVVADMCGPTPACIMQTMLNRALAGLADIMTCSILSDCSYLTASLNESTSTVSQEESANDIQEIGTQSILLSNEITPETSTLTSSSDDTLYNKSANESAAGNKDNIDTPVNTAMHVHYFAGLLFSTGVFSYILYHL